MGTLLEFFGRLHPVVLHAPIGMMIGLLLVEAWWVVRGRQVDVGLRRVLAWACAAGAAAAAASGLLLSQEGGYDAGKGTLFLHKWMGIGSAVGLVLAAVVASCGRRSSSAAYRLVLGASAAVMVPVGHFGGSVTHGENFLWEPFASDEPAAPPSPPAAGGVSGGEFAEKVLPVLQKHCVSCHGESKRKGELSVETLDELMLGGESGAAVVPGDAEGSELLIRMLLPLVDEDHMPPKEKPQPTAEEIEVIRAWIAAGARE